MCSSSDKSQYTQGLILGTHTSDDAERNLLMVVDLRLPSSDAAVPPQKAEDDEGDMGGYGANNVSGKVDIVASMVHEGEVNRCVAPSLLTQPCDHVCM